MTLYSRRASTLASSWYACDPAYRLLLAHPNCHALSTSGIASDQIFQEEIGGVKGHFGPINTLAFHPNGKQYCSGGEDGYVRLHNFDDSYFECVFIPSTLLCRPFESACRCMVLDTRGKGEVVICSPSWLSLRVLCAHWTCNFNLERRRFHFEVGSMAE